VGEKDQTDARKGRPGRRLAEGGFVFGNTFFYFLFVEMRTESVQTPGGTSGERGGRHRWEGGTTRTKPKSNHAILQYTWSESLVKINYCPQKLDTSIPEPKKRKGDQFYRQRTAEGCGKL